jgi:drug/metabolite transporter (DMT)-like permease
MKKIYLILPILSGILFGSCGIFVRILTQNGLDSPTLLFTRFSVSIMIMLIVILATDKNLLKISIDELKIIVIAAINILALNLCYNISTNTIPLSLAAVLLSLAPVFVIIFAYIAFREKINKIKITSMILIILGCILTTGLLEGNVFNVSTNGILAGIGTAFFWANYNVASKKSLKKGTHTHTLLFYTLILMTVALIPFTNFNQINTYINMDICTNTIFLIFNALLTFILPYVLLTLAINYVDLGSIAIFTAGAEPLAALCFGIILYNETPTLLIITGIIITIIAITILSKNEYKTEEV